MSHFKYAFLLMFFVSAIASVWLFVKRHDLREVDWQEATHGDLYGVPQLGPRMTGVEYDNKQLTILIEGVGSCESWQIKTTNGMNSKHMGQHPSFILLEGQHEYIIRPGDCSNIPARETMTVEVLFVPHKKMYANDTEPDLVRIVNMPLFFSLHPGASFDRWFPPLGDFGKEKLTLAQDFLNQIGLVDSMDSMEKVALVSHALRNTLPLGPAPIYLNLLDPMEILDEAISARADAFSHDQQNLVQVFLLNVAGVPSRIVSSGRDINGVSFGGHNFSESYISKQARWAYSDIRYNISYITDREGYVLNAADILSVVSNQTGQGLNTWFNDTKTPTQKPWENIQGLLKPWYNKNITLTFRGSHDQTLYKIKLPFFKGMQYRMQRYLFEPVYYFGYQRSFNFHWVRGSLVLLNLISGLMLILAIGLKKRNA